MTTRFDTGLPASGDLQLQVCASCGQVNHPRRELCGNCLGDTLDWQTVDSNGVVQSMTELHHSLESQYANHLPWPVASVKLDCGPIAFAHLQPGLKIGDRTTVRIIADSAGNHLLAALGDNVAEAEQWITTMNFREKG